MTCRWKQPYGTAFCIKWTARSSGESRKVDEKLRKSSFLLQQLGLPCARSAALKKIARLHPSEFKVYSICVGYKMASTLP